MIYKFSIFRHSECIYLYKTVDDDRRETVCITNSAENHKSFIDGLLRIMEEDDCYGFPVTTDMRLYSNDPRLIIESKEYGYYIRRSGVEFNPKKEEECCKPVFTPEEIHELRKMNKWYGKVKKEDSTEVNTDATDNSGVIDAGHAVYNKYYSNCHKVNHGEVVMIEMSSDIAPQCIASLYFSCFKFKTVKMMAKYNGAFDRYEVKYSNDTSVYVEPRKVLSVTAALLTDFGTWPIYIGDEHNHE